MIPDKETAAELCENALARHISYRLMLKAQRLPVGDAHEVAKAITKTWSRERMTHFWLASKKPNTFVPHREWAHALKVRRAEVERWSQQLRALAIEAVDPSGAVAQVRLFRGGIEHLSRNHSKEYGNGGCAINLGRDARTTLEAAESVVATTEKQTETCAENYVGALAVKQGADLPVSDASTADRVTRAASAIRGARGEQLALVPRTSAVAS